VAIDISKYTKLILKLAKEGFKKGFNKAFDEKLASTIFDDLNTAASTGYGDKWIKFDPYHSPTVQQLQKNLLFFSVGKSAEQLKAMNALLIDEKGKIRNWQSFRDEVLKMNKQYNLRYLQAEYQTAKSSAQMARKWQEAQKRKHLYPNLKYLTVHDSHVREQHDKLHGIVRHIDDPWWNTHYPPNGWRCRCSAQSTRDAVTPKDKIPHVPVHKHFRHNVGKTGKIFDEKHTYFKHINDCKDKQPNAGLKDCKNRLLVKIEKLKLKFPLYKVRYKAKNGAKVYVSPFADKSDLFGNYKDAIKMAEKGIEVNIRPHVKIEDVKNPEYYIFGLIGDRAIPKSLRGILSSIDEKVNKQKCEIIVINTDLIESKWFNIAKTVKGGVNKNKKLKKIILIKGNKVFYFTRKEVLSKKYWEKILKKGD